MTGQNRVRRMRAAVVLAALLAVAGGTMWLHYGQAQTVPFAPQVTAAFETKEKDSRLVVGVLLSANQQQGAVGKLQVDVLDSDGKSLAQATKGLTPADDYAGYRFEFPLKKEKTDGLTVRCILGNKQHEVALDKVLLAKGHETSLFTSTEFFAGSKALFQVGVHGVRSVKDTVPLPGSDVTITLEEKDKKHTLFQGRVDGTGKIAGEFQVPVVDSGSYSLTIVTRSPMGEEKMTRSVKIKSDAKVLLLTDKPIYQPGQLMHLRALALHPFDLKPVAKTDLVFEVEDAKGNKVFRKTLQTSDYGIAAVDFQLASEVNNGNYQIRAIIGKQTTEKTVSVKPYVLPKFKTVVTADKQFYLPKETIKAELQSDYFFGKPVANSKVEVVASTFDVEFKQFETWKGKTDANGHAKFEIKLPDYFVGQPLQKGNAMVKLEVKLTDTAEHKEEITKTYTVSDQPIQVSLIPEGGKLAPGLENRVFAAAIYPDGSPAVCDVSLWLGKEAKGEPLATVKTNAAGLAEFTMSPKADQFRQGGWKTQNVELLGGSQNYNVPEFFLDIYATAKDAKGSQAKATVALNSHNSGNNVVLRLDKAIYDSNEAVKLDVLSSAGTPTVYLDVVRGGQIVLSKWLEVKNGKANYSLDLPPDLFGSLDIHAYAILMTGEIIRDSRVIYVQPREELKVEIKGDKNVFAPGETGQIQFLVTDSAGKGVQAALGVIVVDEAVYALQELQPGLEKVYFTLQEELMKPQAQVLPYGGGDIKPLLQQGAVPANKQQMAQVLLTAVKVQPPAQWQLDPALQRKNEYEGKVLKTGWSIYQHVAQHANALKFNDDTGKWEFTKNLMEQMITQGFYQGNLQLPLGDTLTLGKLIKNEAKFDVQHLTGAITKNRMKSLADALVAYAEANKKDLHKDGQWTLPDGILVLAAKSAKLPDNTLRDAWGTGFRLVSSKKQANKTGVTLFDQFDIVSAGPDRDYQSADDIRWTKISHDATVEGWWSDQSALQVAQFFSGMKSVKYELEELRNALEKATTFAPQLEGKDANKKFDGFPPGLPGGGFPGGPGGAPGPDVPKAANGNDHAGGKGAGGPPTDAGPGPGPGTAAPITKVRDYFPETMLWQPSLITDENGKALLNINFADSITTWRLSASASSKGGALGSTSTGLKVFQDFFVDIDLPLNLTQNDEVAFPVAIFNYLKEPQTVKLQLEKEGWFELLPGEELSRTVNLKPNEVTAVSYHIRAKKVGSQPITVKAYGTKKSDAVKRVVSVVPDGKKIEVVHSDQLKGKVGHTVTIPETAIADSSKLIVRVYPGVMAQVLEGIDGMMRMPGGCFEQTSSSAYPNVLVVDYMKKNKIASPQIMMKAEQYLNAGYQRLLTFERPGGGFDWWGSGEPLVWLSAYGLNEFADMAKVWPVDKGIIDRTQNFLLKKMDKDGTWSNIGATHSETIASMGNPKLLLTSYVAWSLLDSGLPKDKVSASIHWIRNNIAEAGDNAYVMALAANALAAYDAKDVSTIKCIEKLNKLREEQPEAKACFFPAKTTSLNYGTGPYVNVETTALAILAMVRTGQFTPTVNQSMTYLIKAKGNGSWGSTSATILSLKALLAGSTAPQIKGKIDFAILVNGKEAQTGTITQENAEVMQVFDLGEFLKAGANDVQIQTTGETNLMYQVVGRHFEPWAKDQAPDKKSDFEFKISYDRTKLETHDILRVKAKVTYHGKQPANMVMVDLGVAPGFSTDAGDFAEMVDKKQISKFSLTPSQIILYTNGLAPGETRTFEYTLKAKYPLKAQTPPSTVYEYYTPNHQVTAAPVTLTVTPKK